jgi:asparagine N-glycosylation enzyme membrane subunit Stt3
MARRRVPGPVVAAGGVVLVALLFAGAYALAPQARGAVEQLLAAKTELVREQTATTVGRYLFLGGTPSVLALFGLPIALVAAWRGRDRRATLAPLLLGALVVGLWLKTRDYGYVAPGFLSLLAAYAVVTTFGWLRPRWTRGATALVLAAAVVLPIWPLEKVVPPHRPTDGLRSLLVIDEGWVHALRWLEAHSAPPPERYGVLAFWDFGHFIAAIADRLPLASGAISRPHAAWFLFEDEEQAVMPETLGLRTHRDVRYVIVDARTAGDLFTAGLEIAGRTVDDYRRPYPRTRLEGRILEPWVFGGRYPRTMTGRLYMADGAGLGRFRQVYRSPQKSALFFTASPAPDGGGTRVTRRSILLATPELEQRWQRRQTLGKPVAVPGAAVYDVAIQPTVKIYEIVRGAVLSGTALPGAQVEARLDLRAAASGETIAYRRAAQADAQGRFLITVAYPTEPDPHSDLVAGGGYAVTGAGATVATGVKVGVAEVRRGARIAVP